MALDLLGALGLAGVGVGAAAEAELVSLTDTTVVKAIAILGGETSSVATQQFAKSTGEGSDDN